MYILLSFRPTRITQDGSPLTYILLYHTQCTPIYIYIIRLYTRSLYYTRRRIHFFYRAQGRNVRKFFYVIKRSHFI